VQGAVVPACHKATRQGVSPDDDAMTQKRVLVIGANGMLGRDLVPALKSAGFDVIGVDREELDITDQCQCRAGFQRYQPKVVINCAAYTRVDQAEIERDLAFQINAVGAGYVARAAAFVGALCIFISTDYVFDGTRVEPYDEWAPPCAINAYGASKLAGEHRTMAEAKRWAIVRTSWLFGSNGPNFVKAILARARSGQPLRVVCDQVGAPTYTVDLSQALCEIATREVEGILHRTNDGWCSWHEFAQAILNEAGLGEIEVAPIPASEYPARAPRPANSRLAAVRATQLGLAPLPPWRDALRRYLAETEMSDS